MPDESQSQQPSEMPTQAPEKQADSGGISEESPTRETPKTPEGHRASPEAPASDDGDDNNQENHIQPAIESALEINPLNLSPMDSVLFEIQEQVPPAEEDIPWTLQQYFAGEIDLESELSTRFSSMPLMSLIKFRTLGTQTGRGVATVSAPDGSAEVIFDADKNTGVVHMSFTLGSMLTLRFSLTDLSFENRQRWLDLMQRDEGGLAFLWGPERWEKDYLICMTHKYFTNIYAFSPNNFSAAIRMTPDVTKQLLDWLQTYWQKNDSDDDTPKLLTW